ncbi:MAG: radical SAM family heme chaperone HemW [Acidobacteriota bacterium]|nr:radical SAM family heme chaperone HemW [Acidobacteriota bacterium]
MPLGLYISVPFCKTKCSYCNFASDVFSRAVFKRYVDGLCSDIARASETASQMNGHLERFVDSIYLGGGTPTLLEISQLERIFVTISQIFEIANEAEVTVECAPGTLTDDVLKFFQRAGVNRVSLGVQSFVDKESSSVGRLHTRKIVDNDINRLRQAGISDINVDLIAGLPHQTTESWQTSVQALIATGVPHASVYMLEIDEDSRLGSELIAGGTRYHAHFVPNEDLTADFYESACEQLSAAGILQYEISNFARAGRQSRHNLKYWTRQPYMGFGVDAHSMLRSTSKESEAVRFANSDSLERYVAGDAPTRVKVDFQSALEEEIFLGLRLNRGIKLKQLTIDHVATANADFAIAELIRENLLTRNGDLICLTARGRLLSNDVFQRFISTPEAVS